MAGGSDGVLGHWCGMRRSHATAKGGPQQGRSGTSRIRGGDVVGFRTVVLRAETIHRAASLQPRRRR